MNSKISFIILGIIFTSLIYPGLSAAQGGLKKDDFKVISSDRNSLTIEYTPTYLDTSSSIIKNTSGVSQEFRKIQIESGNVDEQLVPGVPAIPQVKLNIGVPSEFGNTIQVLNVSYKELAGKIIPVPAYIKKDNTVEYKTDANYFVKNQDEELVTFGDYGLIRDLPVQSLLIHPVQFEASLNKIKLVTKILFKVNFSQSQSISSGYKDELASGSVINFESAKYWAKTSKSDINKLAVINSVLTTGKWFRFEAPAEGFYKITRSMLSAYGIDANSVDPRTIKIYNNSGKILSESVAAARPVDLVENAIIVTGESDGKFDEGDMIIFYGRGIDFWDINGSIVSRYFNYYSKENFFWITAGGSNGKRISEKESLNESSPTVISTTPAFLDLEQDKINLLKSGRMFAGEDFTPALNSRTYTNKIDGRVPGTPVNYKIRFINASENAIGLDILENSNTIYSNNNMGGYSSLTGPNESSYSVGRGFVINASFTDSIPANRSMLKFNFKPSGQSSNGYLDYFEISYTKYLTAVDDYLTFFSNHANGTTEYQLNGFSNSNIMVFDITDYSNVRLMSKPVVRSGGEYRFQVNETGSILTKYMAVGNDNYKSPVNPVEVTNSNLHGGSAGAKYVIVTNKLFLSAAEKLKQYRENEAKIKYTTTIVDVDQIYNEFGGGTKDPSSIRDFLKYAYDNWQIKPQYVLFLGSGNYDYRNIEESGTDFVITWQSTEDLFELNSYSSDDYFVCVSGSDRYVDLSTGRIPVKTAADADNIVNKIISYETDTRSDAWRNVITLLSDDGLTPHNDDVETHTRPNEVLAKSYIPQSFVLNKIYLAAYPVQLVSAGRRKPAVNEDIIKYINEGTVIFNYVGHGSPEVWADERVFEKNITIPRLNNDKYFFLTAATCDFGYFDNPSLVSGTEALLFLKNAGSIGALSSVRAVYSINNEALMDEFFRNLFAVRDTLNLIRPVGYIAYLTKQRYNGINDQKFYIFGDPLLRLSVPEYDAKIDTVNGKFISASVSSDTVQVKALSTASISGHINNSNGTIWSDFNGEGILTVFDSDRSVLLQEIGNFPMALQGGILFRGRISITNGAFSANFVVPKDISYENKNGKIVLYFNGNGNDGVGFTNKIIVGGTDASVIDDGKGPDMDVYFDDTSFKESYLINPNSKLIVKLSDQTGINTTGTGVGHKLEGILNDQENNTIDFANYFQGDLDSGGKSGEIVYPFNNIETGDYKLQLKAWDVFNNFTSETVYFSVVSGDELVIKDIYNYPNPFVSNTTFTFQQNLNKEIDVRIKIYTVAGRLIREIERNSLREKYVKIDWDGRDEDGSQIANGTYLYKIIVKTTDGSYNNSVLGKLAVIR